MIVNLPKKHTRARTHTRTHKHTYRMSQSPYNTLIAYSINKIELKILIEKC